MGLNPKIWGPHYWFMIHTIALNYPHSPNDTTKKKYYDFIYSIHGLCLYCIGFINLKFKLIKGNQGSP